MTLVLAVLLKWVVKPHDKLHTSLHPSERPLLPSNPCALTLVLAVLLKWVVKPHHSSTMHAGPASISLHTVLLP